MIPCIGVVVAAAGLGFAAVPPEKRDSPMRRWGEAADGGSLRGDAVSTFSRLAREDGGRALAGATGGLRRRRELAGRGQASRGPRAAPPAPALSERERDLLLRELGEAAASVEESAMEPGACADFLGRRALAFAGRRLWASAAAEARAAGAALGGRLQCLGRDGVLGRGEPGAERGGRGGLPAAGQAGSPDGGASRRARSAAGEAALRMAPALERVLTLESLAAGARDRREEAVSARDRARRESAELEAWSKTAGAPVDGWENRRARAAGTVEAAEEAVVEAESGVKAAAAALSEGEREAAREARPR